VTVGRKQYAVSGELGRGAFAVVHRCRDTAVKVTTARTQSVYESAQLEVELLRMLRGADAHPDSVHLPCYEASSVEKGGVVKIAMGICPGGPLDRALYGSSEEDHKVCDLATLTRGGNKRLTEAVHTTQILLEQMSSVFVRLEPHAFHRDVSSHNVLVDFQRVPPHFSLIDFGLAVRADAWKEDWQTSSICGDPQYWAPAAWIAFSYGSGALKIPGNLTFQRQYVSRIDHYATGILALELLFGLWSGEDAGAAPGMEQLRTAWFDYWSLKLKIFQTFFQKGVDQLRTFLQSQGLRQMVDLFAVLKRALREAAALNPQHSDILHKCEGLISEAGNTAWSEFRANLPVGQKASSSSGTTSSDGGCEDMLSLLLVRVRDLFVC